MYWEKTIRSLSLVIVLTACFGCQSERNLIKYAKTWASQENRPNGPGAGVLTPTPAPSPPDLSTGLIYYIGPFAGSVPLDDPECGLGKGASPNPHPCATLPYWNKIRRTSLTPGSRLRFAPGTYRDSGEYAGQGQHCILLDRYAHYVTYEGRTAADGVLNNHESVKIDQTGIVAGGYTGDNPCQGSGVVPTNVAKCNSSDWGPSQDYSGFTINSIMIENSPHAGMKLCAAKHLPAYNITIEHVRLSKTAGVDIGAFDNSNSDPDCVRSGRTVKNLRMVDSEVNGPAPHFPGSMMLACMDTAVLERVKVHDTCARADCGTCEGYEGEENCDDFDGIVGAGAINVTIRDSEVYRVGEDGLDAGGHPAGKSYNWLIERTKSHNNPGGNFKTSGSHNITIRNSFSWGKGAGYSSYGCPRNIKLYNNTFVNTDRPVMMYNYNYQSEFLNNIFLRVGANTDVAVYVDFASTNPTNTWKNNVVANLGGTNQIGDYDGAQLEFPACNGFRTNGTYKEGSDCSLGYRPPPIPCPLGPKAPGLIASTSQGLQLFKDQGAAGYWFGAASGQNDIWGVSPNFVNINLPDALNLHLLSTDIVARNRGLNLSNHFAAPFSDTNAVYEGFNQDFDKILRAPAWDIGADESP